MSVTAKILSRHARALIHPAQLLRQPGMALGQAVHGLAKNRLTIKDEAVIEKPLAVIAAGIHGARA